jgi:hypothetical protein
MSSPFSPTRNREPHATFSSIEEPRRDLLRLTGKRHQPSELVDRVKVGHPPLELARELIETDVEIRHREVGAHGLREQFVGAQVVALG